MRVSKFILSALMVWAASAEIIQAKESDHARFDGLLRRHVTEGLVNYAGLMEERATLQEYLQQIAESDPDSLKDVSKKIAFWINAYNAVVLERVLEYWPLQSVQAVSGFFDAKTALVGGGLLTLDAIEDQARAFKERRVHFALVCASSSCPKLRSEAYTAERLEAQLSEQAVSFLADSQHGVRLDGETLWVSRIFDWYRVDFGQSKPMFGFLNQNFNLNAWARSIKPWLPSMVSEALRQRPLKVRFMEYDWAINVREAGR